MFKYFLKLCHGLKKDQKGSSAIEFAITAPIFFLLVLTGIDLAIMFFEQYSLNYAVSYAARYAYLHPYSTNQQIKTYALSMIPTLPDTVTFTINTNPTMQSSITASLTHNFIFFSHAGLTLTSSVIQPMRNG